MKEPKFLSDLRPLITKVLQVTHLNKIAHKIYYNHVHGFNPSIRTTLPAVERCLKAAKESGVLEKGDYFEFGIFKGYTFLHVQKLCTELGIEDVKYFGFDSFAGLPPVEGIDKTKLNEFYEGQYKCVKDQVIENLNTGEGVDWDRTYLIEGYFDQSLNEKTRDEHPMNKVGLALIDCDLYSSTNDVLSFIKEMLIDGSILMMDDWNSFNADNNKGERLAFSEFLEQNSQFKAKELFSYPPYGQVFEIQMSNNTTD